MELIYYIYDDENNRTMVDRETYEQYGGMKCIRSGFAWIFPDGAEIDESKLFLGLRW